MTLDDLKWVAIFVLFELGLIGLAVWKALHDDEYIEPRKPPRHEDD